jgi:hypothetical protein
MMLLKKWAYFAKAWLWNLLSFKTVLVILSSFGALWLIVQMVTFFFPETPVFGKTKLPDAIRNLWPLFFIAGLLSAALARRPHLTISHKLNGRDVSIGISVGDVFSFSGAVVIGSNTTFDTRISNNLISKHSVQGGFTNTYYDDERQIEAELSAALNNLPFEQLPGQRAGNSKRFAIGTCVALHPKNRTGYLLAIAHINEHGVASGTFEDLKVALAKLWVFIGNRGSKGPIVMPVLGTGSSRLPQPREEIVREIIKSFVAACSERTFCDNLTIVITPRDMSEHHISLRDLDSFLEHECKYTVFAGGNRPPVGTAA